MDEAAKAGRAGVQIAGFWRRLFAFCLDAILLGVLGACIGLIDFDGLAALGDWGRAVGFAVALFYFGAMDGRLFGGQTLGKRMLGIKVICGAGAPLSVGASMLRAGIFCVPYFMNNAMIDTGAIASWLSVLLSVVVFGVGISIVYLLLFNRHTRQSLHDLAVGAYVVSNVTGVPVDRPPVWRVHYGIVGLIMITALALPFVAQRIAGSDEFAGLLSVQQGLQQESGVRHATAMVSVNTFSGHAAGVTTNHVFSSRIFLSHRVTEADSMANRLARIILDRDPSAENEDLIAIALVYGYDIGIASAWRVQNFSFSPAQWRNRLAAP